MLTKQELYDLFKAETDITFKVLDAVPADQLEFKPHEKSSPVKQLLKTFMADMTIANSFMSAIAPENPFEGVGEFETLEEGIKELRKHTNAFLEKLNSMSDEDLSKDFTAWGSTKPVSGMTLWLLFDHIHHRGQLSVYVRLAGGKVPAIYGPSADDQGGM